MDSLRTTKLARLIQKELGELFRLETQKMRGVMISVTEVRLSPDLSIAHAYLSIFPDSKVTEMMADIKDNTSTIRYNLGARCASQLRRIPELYFHLDNSLNYAMRIDELLAQNPVKPSDETMEA